MNVVLQRFYQGSRGSFGFLTVNEDRYFTVERPWRGNKPYISCVPPGDYDVVWDKTGTDVPDSFEEHTWFLTGDSVGLDKGSRTRIAFHVANVASEVQGCIGVGNRVGFLGDKMAVLNSRSSLSEMRRHLPDEFKLVILRSP